MSDSYIVQPKKEGETIDCPNCGKPIISRLAVYPKNPEWNKIIWQELDETKAHYDNKGNCKTQEASEQTTQQSTDHQSVDAKEEIKVQASINPKVAKVTSPFEEAELITRWAEDLAYKIAMAGVTDYSKLTVQEKSGIGQKTGMLTKCLVDTTIELMKIHGIKSDYGAK